MTRISFVLLCTYLAAGCSLSLELGTKQCSSATDCFKVQPDGETYQCVKGICEHLTCNRDPADPTKGDEQCQDLAKEDSKVDLGPAKKAFEGAICEVDSEQGGATTCQPSECADSTECENRGGTRTICDKVGNRCIRPSEATCPDGTSEECARFDTLPVCAGGRCADSQCEKTEDCLTAMSTPTVKCEKGACVDESWGCIGEEDDRERSSDLGTYKVRLVSVVTNTMPDGLEVTACGGSIDNDCNEFAADPLPVKYDRETGWVTITGWAPRSLPHLLINAPGFVETEFYSTRTIVGVTEEPVQVPLISYQTITVLEGQTGTKVDIETGGTVVFRFLDCQDPAVPGARVAVAVPRDGSRSEIRDPDTNEITRPGTYRFYITPDNIPDNDAMFTFATGAAGLVNLNPGRLLSFDIDLFNGPTIMKYQLAPQAKRVTYAIVHPRSYIPF